jgi:hypothetical protein
MGKLSFEVPHQLSREEAKKRVEQLTGYWATKYGVATQWAGDTATLVGKVMGLKIEAQLTVAEGKVGGEASDPGFLFRKKAQDYLNHKFTQALKPGGPGDVHDA